MVKRRRAAISSDSSSCEEDPVYVCTSQSDGTPQDPAELGSELLAVEQAIFDEELRFFQEQDEVLNAGETEDIVPSDCIPIPADIRSFDFKVSTKKSLAERHQAIKGRLFDAIMMDPPWQLSGANPTRGVTISYDSLLDQEIGKMPIPVLQTEGLIFIWTINAKYTLSLSLLDKWGYTYVDEIVWVKKTCNNKIAKSHGYWLQHAKETCLVGRKGNVELSDRSIPDVIFSQRRGQSQKPEEIYQMIEELLPGGCYLEVFGRRNNLRNGWVTIGNEI
jgi:mRNA (2'-O-methyladenosine-N6-)-methyltransferase